MRRSLLNTKLLEVRFEAELGAEAPHPSFVELRNLCEVGRLVVHSARMRPESRGLHTNVDHPYRDNEGCLRYTILSA
jgi:L-aspartate oxidase